MTVDSIQDKTCSAEKMVTKGLKGVVAADTTISDVDGDLGKLIYRGYSIDDLANFSTFEETAYLLRTPANAKRLLAATAQLNAGKGVERKLAK